jgi:hypothetical protein
MNLKKLFHIPHDGQTEMIQPVLSISLGEKNFSFAISNAQANQFYHLASFTADEMNIEVLAEILSLHPEASASFYKVSVCYCYPKHVMMPQEFYSQNNFVEVWKAVHGVSAGKNTVSENAVEWQANDVYTIPQDVQQFLMRRYPSASFKNFPILALRNLGNSDNGLMQIDFGVDEFELVAVNQNNLLLAERFEYVTPNDVIYVLLNLCNTYSLSQYKVKVKITGLVDKDSALYKEMYQYFMDIEFRSATWSHAGYPGHFFTVLNDIARCAS